MPETLRDALEACWQRLRRGESLEQCTSEYPQYGAQLQELLGITLRYSALPQGPTPDFRARSLRRTLLAAQRQRDARPRRLWYLFSQPALRWVGAAAAALILVFSGGELAWATADSLPGSPLYPVKEAHEQASILLTGFTRPPAELETRQAERRVSELERMLASPGHESQVPMALRRIGSYLNQAVQGVQNAPGDQRRALLARLIRLINRADQELADLEGQAQGAILAETKRLRQRIQQFHQRLNERPILSSSSRPSGPLRHRDPRATEAGRVAPVRARAQGEIR